MVAHFVCILFTGFIIYTAQPGSSLFSWHPTLMSLAFMFLVAEGILIFSPQSSLLQQYARKTKVTYHWVLMVSAALSVFTGYAVIYASKEQKEKPHLTSWHGLCGFVTVLYIALQCTGGLNLLYPQTLARYVKLGLLKQMHATSGLMLFLLAMLSLITGMSSNWFTSIVTGTSWYACITCPLLLLLIIMNQVKNTYLSK